MAHTSYRQLTLSMVVALTLVLWPAVAGRAGSEAASEALRYTALGDSLASGAGAERSYVPRFAAYLAQDRGVPVDLHLAAVSGWTSFEMLQALRNDADLRAHVRESDVVSWNVGGSDLLIARALYKQRFCGGHDGQWCLRLMDSVVRANWRAIAEEIRALRGDRPTVLLTIDLYYATVREDVADGSFTVMKPYLANLNRFIAGSAIELGYDYAHVADAFNGPNRDEDPAAKGLIADDGIHPNDTGHELIAQLLRALDRPLRLTYLPVVVR